MRDMKHETFPARAGKVRERWTLRADGGRKLVAGRYHEEKVVYASVFEDGVDEIPRFMVYPENLRDGAMYLARPAGQPEFRYAFGVKRRWSSVDLALSWILERTRVAS